MFSIDAVLLKSVWLSVGTWRCEHRGMTALLLVSVFIQQHPEKHSLPKDVGHSPCFSVTGLYGLNVEYSSRAPMPGCSVQVALFCEVGKLWEQT